MSLPWTFPVTIIITTIIYIILDWLKLGTKLGNLTISLLDDME